MQRLRQRLADESLLALLFAVFAGLRIITLPAQLGQDSWLTLVGGREVVEHGLPSVDTLTVLAHGVEWVDQQWLAQALFYGVEQAGTVKAVLGLHALLVTGAFAAALVAARVLGGTPRSVARIGLVAAPSILIMTWQMRAQSLAYVLFIAVLWLLVADARAASRRVWLVLPLLALWANVHGSVVLGAGLVCALALTSAVRLGPFGLRIERLPRAALLAAGALACLFVSPYGLDLVGYYGDTLVNSGFGRFVTEWAPSTPKPLTAPFYLLAFVAVWSAARHRDRLTPFEILALAMLLVGGMLAVRSIAWFAFAALMIVPGALGSGDEDAPQEAPEALRFAVAIVACAVVVAAGVAFLARAPEALEEEEYPRALGASIAQAARDPSVRVYASVRHADWLLWTYPSLAGRVAYDARFELLSGEQLSRIYRFLSQVGHGWERHAAGYALVVLPRDRGIAIPHTRPTYRVLLDEGGFRIRYRDEDTVVLERMREAA